MAANCTHHPPSVIPWLLNKSHTKRKILFITKNKKRRKKKKEKKKGEDWAISRKTTRYKEQPD